VATVVFVETNFSGLEAILYCKQQGYRTVLVSDSVERFRKWFPESTLYILDEVDQIISVPNSNDLEAVADVLKKEVGKFDAILTFAEIRTLVTARLAKYFGLPGANPDAIKLAQDKFTFRKVLMAKGVDNVQCQLIHSARDLLEVKNEIRYPCFLKPVQGHSSIGAVMCKTIDDVERISAELSAIKEDWISAAFVVEDYLDGDLYSVEILTTGPGKHHVIGISDRDVVHDSVEIGSSFPLASPLCESIEKKACAALDAIDYNFGPSHIEIIVQDGIPHLVEVNVRVGGSGHSIMLALATLRSIVGDCIELCLGKLNTDSKIYEHRQGAAWKCFVSEQVGFIKNLPSEDEIKSKFDVEHVWLHHQVGDEVSTLNSNYNWIIQVMCRGKDREEAKHIAGSVINYVAENTVIA
jgi:biotin carboxylase